MARVFEGRSRGEEEKEGGDWFPFLHVWYVSILNIRAIIHSCFLIVGYEAYLLGENKKMGVAGECKKNIGKANNVPMKKYSCWRRAATIPLPLHNCGRVILAYLVAFLTALKT